MLFEKQILDMYKGMMYTRCDDEGKAFYFSHHDFEGLHCEECCFRASAGHRLQGYLYSYDNPIEGRLVVFDHGFGGGHRSYMKEIMLIVIGSIVLVLALALYLPLFGSYMNM